MKIIRKIGILALVCILMFSALSLNVFAEDSSESASNGVAKASTEANDARLGDIDGEDTTLGERIEFALQGTATGLLMVFAVLALLAIVVSLSKVILYDIPRKARESAAAEAKAEAEKEEAILAPAQAAPAPIVQETDDGELIAVITAAIAAAIDSGEYGSEFESGFRVVSFKRADTSAWNKR